MAKEKTLGSRMNGLFRFNEKDHIAGFYKGSQTIKNGEAILISTLDGEKVAGVPNYTTIKDVTSKLEEGDFLLLMYKGEEEAKSGFKYMNVVARAWELEPEEAKEWDKERTNVAEVLDLMPDYEPDPEEVGTKAGQEESISDDDLPF